MKLLLDTHALLWALYRPTFLSKLSRQEIEDGKNQVCYSPASIWELGIKTSKGQLIIEGDLLEALDSSNFIELPIKTGHSWKVSELPFIHSDPFDRILVAQAMLEKMTLVTRDQFLGSYNVPVLIA